MQANPMLVGLLALNMAGAAYFAVKHAAAQKCIALLAIAQQ